MKLRAAAGAALLLGAAASRGVEGGDPVRGRIVYEKCYACHALEPGEHALAGPNLHDIVGRPIAAEGDFEYSAALRELAMREGRWTEQLIDRYVADPRGFLPGTDMTFTGIRDPAERTDLIAYLREPRPSQTLAR